jgi:hypothetical protein
MKYIIFILIFCIIISIVFSNIKIRDKKEKFYKDSELDLILEDECKNKKNIKENYYDKDRLRLILYDIDDVCKIKTFKGYYPIDLKKKYTLELLDEIKIDSRYANEYNLNDRSKNIWNMDTIPSIGNQGDCGSCYAYALATLIYHDLKTHNTPNLRELSIKHLVDCLSIQKNIYFNCTDKIKPCKGCAGCYISTIIKYYFSSYQTIFYEDCYNSDILKCRLAGDEPIAQEYLGKPCYYNSSQVYEIYNFIPCDSSMCNSYNFTAVEIPPYDLIELQIPSCENRVYVSPTEINAIKKLLYAYGPLNFLYLGADTDDFGNYKKGVFKYPTCSTTGLGLHYLVIIGWKKIRVSLFKKKECWIVRNSWGTDWGTNSYLGGEKGYMFIPTTYNIFYRGTISAIRRQRQCIPPPLTLTGTSPITCSIEVINIVNYTKTNSQCEILARAFMGRPYLIDKKSRDINAQFLLRATKILKYVSNINYPPTNIIYSGQSKPRFSVKNDDICYGLLREEQVIDLEQFYFDNIDGKPNGKPFDSNINRFFYYKLKIDIDTLIYNTNWIFSLTFADPYNNNKILSNCYCEIKWNLAIKIIENGKYIDTISGNEIYFIKFEVLVPINEPFNLVNTKKSEILDTFPNKNIFLSIPTNFIPDSGILDGYPLNSDIYYYISADPIYNNPILYYNIDFFNYSGAKLSTNIIN